MDIFILTVFLFMFLALTQLRIYFRTELRAYGLFGGAFFVAALDSLLYGIIGIEIAFYMVPNQIIYYMTCILMILTIIDVTSTRYKIYILIFVIFAFTGSFIRILTDIFPEQVTGIFMEAFGIVIGAIMIYSIVKGHFNINKKNVLGIKYMAMTIGFLLILMM